MVEPVIFIGYIYYFAGMVCTLRTAYFGVSPDIGSPSPVPFELPPFISLFTLPLVCMDQQERRWLTYPFSVWKWIVVMSYLGITPPVLESCYQGEVTYERFVLITFFLFMFCFSARSDMLHEELKRRLN